MLEIFDKSRRRVAIGENAFNVTEERKLNSIWYLHFSLPYDDPKRQYCQPFWYVRYDGGELYRIMPEEATVTEQGAVTYQCEHVLATLIDNVLFGYHVVGNLGTYTADCINYVLSHQLTQHWVLDQCDFARQFEYGWEQETLLSALFSIANPLADYMWVTDTSEYPWRLSLKALDATGVPELYVRYGHNMLSYEGASDPQQICTRLYPLGYGEGVNQLTIKGVNGGVPYLQSPQPYLDKYGIIERVWIDRRYEDATSLKAAAQAMLDELQEPLRSYTIGFAQLEGDQGKAEVGKRLRIYVPETGEQIDTYITELTYTYDEITDSTLVVANKSTDIASSIADMADRQRIEQSYAQGATQLYAQTLQANCDSTNGAVMNFYIPDDMRIINKVMAKVRLGRFRSYSKTTESAGSNVITSSSSEQTSYTSTSGGGTTATTTDGGRKTYTTDSTPQEVRTTTSEAETSYTSTAVILSAENIQPADSSKYNAAVHDHGIEKGLMLAVYGGGYVQWTPSGAHIHGAHDHKITVPAHNHSVTVPQHNHSVLILDHSHSVTVPSHSHNVTIPGHSHSVAVPGHSHEITPGIFFSGSPTGFSLWVNGSRKASFAVTDAEIDLTAYLVDASTSMIPRGSWLSLEIRPDDLAYVSIDLYVQGFVQSRGDNTV